MGQCCNSFTLPIEVQQGKKKVVLAGNPNVGKSVFFNEFTGLYVDVSNFPGTTLDISYGVKGDYVILDTPGVYGISSFNDEERIARDIILHGDIIVNVVNALNLERDLFLTQQIIDTQKPVIVALNMIDEAMYAGVEIDIDKLSEKLGVPVIPTIATKKENVSKVFDSIGKAKAGNSSLGQFVNELQLLSENGIHSGEALLILESDPVVAERNNVQPKMNQEEIYRNRRTYITQIIAEVVKQSDKSETFKSKLSRWMIRPLSGAIILAGMLYAMYLAIGVFVAQTIIEITEEMIMGEMYEPFIVGILSKFFAEDTVIAEILYGEFGVLTMTPIYVLGLLLPLVAGFYFFLALFEDTGYLPRIAAFTDRLMSSIGLNGKAIIPMILGFGCVTMATITTRMLASDRERRMSIFLLGLAIPCSAQLAVIVALLAGAGFHYALLYGMVIFIVFGIVGMLLNNVLPGKSTDLLLDLPPLRLPILKNVLQKTFTRSYHFIKEAFPLFAIGALIISIFKVTKILDFLIELFSPITVSLLGLPKEAAIAFIMGIVRRDFGAAGLNELALSGSQVLIALVTITLFVPCIASVLVLFKERSTREGAVMWASTFIIAFLMGGLVHGLLSVFSGLGDAGAAYASIAVLFATLVVVAFITKYRRDKNEESSVSYRA